MSHQGRSRRLVPFLIGLVGCLALGSVAANASDGVVEINQTCASVGCFPGDSPGFPVTITSSGSYRMTSSLNQTVVGTLGAPANGIEIQASFSRIDMNGFRISCNGILGGTCSGSASGVAVTGGTIQNPVEEITVENGTVTGMPGNGFSINAGGAVLRNVSAVNNGADGINTESFFGLGGLVENSIARNNGDDGIRVGFDALVRGSVASRNGGFSIAGGNPILGGPSGSGYTECVTDGPTTQITDLGSNL